jgi:hypothetical protein
MPFKFSFHSVTFPSPQLTAKIFPARLHETLQTTSGNFPAGIVAGAPPPPADCGGSVDKDGSKAVLTQGEVGVSFVQIKTVLSYEVLRHQFWNQEDERDLPEKQLRCNF